MRKNKNLMVMNYQVEFLPLPKPAIGDSKIKHETNVIDFLITRYRERIYHVKVLGGSSKIARYIEILVIQSGLNMEKDGEKFGTERFYSLYRDTLQRVSTVHVF